MNIPPKPPGQPAALHPIVAGQASTSAAPASGALHAPQAGPSMPHKSGSPGPSSSKASSPLLALKKAPQKHKGKEPEAMAGNGAQPLEADEDKQKVFESLRAALKPLALRY